MFQRPVFKILKKRVAEPRRFIQILAGPRQTGKTTLARQLIDFLDMPCHYASADEPMLKDTAWVAQQWEAARLQTLTQERGRGRGPALLVLDEVQKLLRWSETVKRLWDEDTAAGLPLHVVLLGSSPLLVRRGLTESLAGRFEVIPVSHWSFAEMEAAFGWSFEEYVYYGGYPGAAQLATEPERWMRYVLDALVETSVSRDILLMTRVDKPALLRRLFELGCAYSGRVLSYQKMLGQLQDAGNTTTLAHYLDLLAGAGLIVGLQKYAGERVRRRASSPKLVVLNTALMTATHGTPFDAARRDTEFWGHLVESAVGAHLANATSEPGMELSYWAHRDREVDFVLRRGQQLVAIEVKSSHRRDGLPGLAQFGKEFGPVRTLLVGADGIPLDDFLRMPADAWFS